MNYFLEAIIVGLILTIIGFPISLFFRVVNKDKSPFSTWFIYTLLTFFLAGALAHLILEWSGINKKYCKQGHACKKI